MLPGPDLVLACPHCGATARLRSISSGNTFGGHLWSDGAVDFPMLPSTPLVEACNECRQVYWVDDATEVDRFYPSFMAEALGFPELVDPESYEDRPVIRSPTAYTLRRAIDAGLGTTREREVALRVAEWHEMNEPYRDGKMTPPEPDPSLRRVVEVSDDLFLGATVAHALGDQDLARRLIGEVKLSLRSLLNAQALSRMAALVEASDRRIVDLTTPPASL